MGPVLVSGQIASLSLLKLSLGMLNIGQGGSALGSDELGRGAFLLVAVKEEESSPGGSVSPGGGAGSGAGADC